MRDGYILFLKDSVGLEELWIDQEEHVPVRMVSPVVSWRIALMPQPTVQFDLEKAPKSHKVFSVCVEFVQI